MPTSADEVWAPLAWGAASSAGLLVGAVDDRGPGTPEVLLSADHRGVTRPQAAGCDIGAYEAVPEPGRVMLELVAMVTLVDLRRWRAER